MALSPTSSHGAAAFNGGTITQPLTIAWPDPNTPALTVQRVFAQLANDNGSIVISDEFSDTPTQIAPGGISCRGDLANQQATFYLATGRTFSVLDHGSNDLLTASDATGVVSTPKGGAALSPLTSGALPTAAFVSTTARQLSTTRDVCCVVPFTGDATNNAATLKLELSPDNVTYSTLDTLSIAAALNLTGAINVPVTFAVPAGWYAKLTATHGTIGTATYY